MRDAGTVMVRSAPVTAAVSFDVLHFSTVFPGRALPRLVRRIESRGVQVVFDLEDTHWIPTDVTLTTELKRRARRHLAELLESPFATGPSFGVKVNAFGTEDGDRDVALLASLVPRHQPHAVILPKVESAATVDAFLRACENAGVTCEEVVPLIETTRGVERVEDLLDGLAAANLASPVRRIMYGANDYCLDSGRWPFWRQDEREFWELVQSLARTIEAHGFGYVHTPFASLQATTGFMVAIQRLRAICQDRFTISTLDEAQSTAALRARDGLPLTPDAPRGPTLSDAEALALAHRVVKLFDERRRRDHGFVVDSSDGRFIPPHEYVAAVRHIERRTNARS
jgi:citrate lyase beta subunit